MRTACKSTVLILIIALLVFTATPQVNAGVAASRKQHEPLQIVYFYSSKCLNCVENQHFIDELKKIDGVSFLCYNVDKADVSGMQAAFASFYGISDADALGVPKLYFGSHCYVLRPDNYNEVLNQIAQYLSGLEEYTNFQFVSEEWNDVVTSVEKFAQQMTVPGILLAGLLDGVNPCAISILLVFFSLLFYTDKRKIIFLLSTLFILGVFVANFTFGIGVKFFYNALTGNKVVIVALYVIAACVCLSAFTINCLDIFKNKDTPKNQLPNMIKFKLSFLMHCCVFSKYATILAFFVGFLVGAVELACTGQMYLPALTYMITSTDAVLSSTLLLVLYNIMFILPLFASVVIAAWIQKPERIKNLIARYNKPIKIIANVFFAVMLFVIIKKLVLIYM